MLRKFLERPEFLKKLLSDNTPEDHQMANSLIVLPGEYGSDADIPNSIKLAETR